MQLISLSVPVQVWPPKTSRPIAVIALVGTICEESGQFRVEVNSVVPASGGLLTFGQPVRVVLARPTLASTQEVEASSSQAGMEQT